MRTTFTSVFVDDRAERLRKTGVRFPPEPVDAGPVRVAVSDDTGGDPVRLQQHHDGSEG